MKRYIVRLVKKEPTKEATQDEAMNKRLKASEEKDSDYQHTLLSPDYAVPEKIKTTRSFSDEMANVAVTDGKLNKIPALSMTEPVRGPWNEEARCSETVFEVEAKKEYGVLVVKEIKAIHTRPLTTQHLLAMRSLLDKKDVLSATEWVEGRPPPRKIGMIMCEKMDRAIEKAQKPYVAKVSAKSKKKEVKPEVLANAVTLYYAAKFETAMPLFFGNTAIYHWSNICEFVKSASLACIFFMVDQAQSAGPALGFARPLLMNARAMGCRYSQFSFPLIRKEVYDNMLTPQVMASYGVPSKAVWSMAYSLFHEIIRRSYMETHELAPWDKGPETGANLMIRDRNDESRDNLPLTGATCLALKDVLAMNIPYTRAALELLCKLGIIVMPKSTMPETKNQEFIYVESMLETERAIARSIRILNERAMKGYMPQLRPDAATNFARACKARYDGEPGALNDLQLGAVASIIVNAVTVLTGSGGCGKTKGTDFVIDNIFTDAQIVIAAPTCAATSRLAGGRILSSMTARTVQYYNRVCSMWEAKTPLSEKTAQQIVEGVPVYFQSRVNPQAPPVLVSYVPPAPLVKLATDPDARLQDPNLNKDENWMQEFALHFPFVANTGLHPRQYSAGEFPDEATDLADDDIGKNEKEETAPRMQTDDQDMDDDLDENGEEQEKLTTVIDALLAIFKKDKNDFYFRNRTIMFLDETAMLSEPAMRFAHKLIEYGYVNRLVLIGDWRQNGPIGPGKFLRTIIERKLPGINVIELTHNYRAAAANRSLVKNCKSISKGRWQKYVVDQYSQILFRMSKSLMWLAAQIYAATGGLNHMITITNKRMNSDILNSAFYILFVWERMGEQVPDNFEQWSYKLRQLLRYLVENSNVNPFATGAAQVWSEATSTVTPGDETQEFEDLKKVKIYYAPGMRISYSTNVNVAKISSNKQMMIVKFMDLDAVYVKKVLESESPDFIYHNGHKRKIPQWCEVTPPHAIVSSEQKVKYDKQCFTNTKLYNAYTDYETNPRTNPRALMRCMVYYNHTPHDVASHNVLYWCPIQLPALAMIPSKVRPAYSRSCYAIQGLEEDFVVEVPDLPESILPKGTKDTAFTREAKTTSGGRAKLVNILCVHSQYAERMNPKPISTNLCTVTNMPDPVTVGNREFFGLNKMVSRMSLLPPSLLPQLVEEELHSIRREVDNIATKCRCKIRHDFVRDLLTMLCNAKRLRVEDDDSDDDEDGPDKRVRLNTSRSDVINETVRVPYLEVEDHQIPMDTVEATFD